MQKLTFVKKKMQTLRIIQPTNSVAAGHSLFFKHTEFIPKIPKKYFLHYVITSSLKKAKKNTLWNMRFCIRNF